MTNASCELVNKHYDKCPDDHQVGLAIRDFLKREINFS